MGDWTLEELAAIRRKQPRCQGCGKGLSWSDRCRQFARLRSKGWAADLIKETSVLPRCQKCLTKWLRSHVGGPAGVADEPVEIIEPGASPHA